MVSPNNVTVCQALKGTGWCSPKILTGYVGARRAGVLLIGTQIFCISIMITSIISLLYDGGTKMQLFSREEADFQATSPAPVMTVAKGLERNSLVKRKQSMERRSSALRLYQTSSVRRRLRTDRWHPSEVNFICSSAWAYSPDSQRHKCISHCGKNQTVPQH